MAVEDYFGGSLSKALEMPGGARFYKCALQVNPYAYLARHGKDDPFGDEANYNEAVTCALLAADIEAICITDHYQVQTAEGLRETAMAAGIHVFPGFEAVTKDGVHLLCIFDSGRDVDSLERVLGDCGVLHHDEDSPTGKYDVVEFLEGQHRWGAVCVAAHVAGDGGLLRKMSGKPRVAAWTSDKLLACALPGAANDAPEGLRQIILNKDKSHKRPRSIAVVNARDVSSPSDVDLAGAWCWIKMDSPSVSGLRQAFIDPESRIRIASDGIPGKHTEIAAIAWEGGFLDGVGLRLNENLNVLVGGRGTGKSTVVESIRYVLELRPVGDEAIKAHDGIVKRVLKNGTKVSLLVDSHHPKSTRYLIERTVPDPPIVRDESGSIVKLRPRDIVPNVEVFGQHEIAELARSPEKLTRLLDRFVPTDQKIEMEKRKLAGDLERSKTRILGAVGAAEEVEEELSRLPRLEEALKRFADAGLAKKLDERLAVTREEQVLFTASERVAEVMGKFWDDPDEEGESEYDVDLAFLDDEELEELPAAGSLRALRPVLQELAIKVRAALTDIDEACQEASKEIEKISSKRDERKNSVEKEYKKTLRELQKEGVDGDELIRTNEEAERLRPLRKKRATRKKERERAESERRDLVAKWQDVKGKEFRALEKAAKRVSRKLRDSVRVNVVYAGERGALLEVLNEIDGRLSEARSSLREVEDLSIPKLVEKWRQGIEPLRQHLGIPKSQAEKLVEAPLHVLLDIEAVDLPATTSLELNTSPDGEVPIWQSLEDLSTGQKATAVLLLTLLESDAPLIVDQPEDDLDNRFITQGVVPRMREEKCLRQFIFTTHNANIPVLGDAELIAGLDAAGEGEVGRAALRKAAVGSIDSEPVRQLVEQVLEGGKEAFEMRRVKYGH